MKSTEIIMFTFWVKNLLSKVMLSFMDMILSRRYALRAMTVWTASTICFCDMP
jgi:hypothetical protein